MEIVIVNNASYNIIIRYPSHLAGMVSNIQERIEGRMKTLLHFLVEITHTTTEANRVRRAGILSEDTGLPNKQALLEALSRSPLNMCPFLFEAVVPGLREFAIRCPQFCFH